ncbi:MAG: cyclase [Marinosulfonomonas sp.]|nr:MAG: cyclase [Marinosulfonomonas sp.]
MTHVLITHGVADFDKWQAAFNDVLPMRDEAGEKSAQIFRDAGDPNTITALFEWDNFENAREYVNSARLKTAMQNAGVTSAPQITFLEDV